MPRQIDGRRRRIEFGGYLAVKHNGTDPAPMRNRALIRKDNVMNMHTGWYQESKLVVISNWMSRALSLQRKFNEIEVLRQSPQFHYGRLYCTQLLAISQDPTEDRTDLYVNMLGATQKSLVQGIRMLVEEQRTWLRGF